MEKDQYLGAHNRVIPAPHYTSNVANSSVQLDWKAVDFGAEHFQGVQRKGRHLILSGGMKYTEPQRAQLIVVEMGSRPAEGPWSIPAYPASHKDPHPADRIVSVVDLDQRLWHAGGIQRDGDVLAVGLFGGGASQVRFYDVRDPTRPVEIEGARIARRAKSHAAGLTTLADGRHLAVAWDDAHLDFYRSRSPDVADGFEPGFQRVHKREAEGGVTPGGCPDDVEAALHGRVGPCGTFQNVNLVTDCDDDTYLLGFRNTNKNILGEGGDFAALYEVRWPGGYDAKPAVRLVDRKHMYCYGPCNFGGGAGIYRAGSAFFIYGVAPYLHGGNDRVNFNEYALGSSGRDHRSVREPGGRPGASPGRD
ncbi:MAG: hypothetical protein R3263_10290, partial [Myxococcota bacterium]|nr:hypothetical protein [Myxococcota bacterium]